MYNILQQIMVESISKIEFQDQGVAELQPEGILKYVEDLKREPKADIVGQKAFLILL